MYLKHESMKTFKYLFILIIAIGCASPQKLVEHAEYEKALKVSTRRLKKGKAKWKNLNAFEKSFRVLTEQDSLQVSALRAEGKPETWPVIYDKAVTISNRQRKVAPVLDRLDGSDFEPVVSLYPASALLDEAADKSALYYYAGALEFLETARKGNRQDAREAYALLERCRDYRVNFKDAPALQHEMYNLGTTHVLLRNSYGSYDPIFSLRLIAEVISGRKYPYRDDWQVFHIEEATVEKPHYFANLLFYDLDVSWERERSSCCSNSETIQTGTVEKKAWNAQDSVWVTVKEPVYETVSVQVRTTYQEKSASLSMHYSLVDAESSEEVYRTSFYGCERWSNVYSDVSGDRRALSLLCDDEGGCRRSFPYDEELLIDAACDIRYGFRKEMKRAVD